MAGGAPPRTEHRAHVQVHQTQVKQGDRQLAAQRLAGLRRPEVELGLSWPYAQPHDGALLVPAGRNHAPRHWLLTACHLLQGGKGLDRGTESRQCLDETGSPLPSLQDAKLALRIVEATAANEFRGRPRERVGQAAETVEHAARAGRAPDGAHQLARKTRAACITSSGRLASARAGAWSSRPGFMPRNQARTVSADSLCSISWTI